MEGKNFITNIRQMTPEEKKELGLKGIFALLTAGSVALTCTDLLSGEVTPAISQGLQTVGYGSIFAYLQNKGNKNNRSFEDLYSDLVKNTALHQHELIKERFATDKEWLDYDGYYDCQTLEDWARNKVLKEKDMNYKRAVQLYIGYIAANQYQENIKNGIKHSEWLKRPENAKYSSIEEWAKDQFYNGVKLPVESEHEDEYTI